MAEKSISVKYIYILVIAGLFIAILESLIGFTAISYGINDKETDVEKSDEMMEFIKTYDINYYNQLVDKGDNSYMKEFKSHYTIGYNKPVVYLGLAIVFMSIFNAVFFVTSKTLSMKMKSEFEAMVEKPKDKEGEESGGKKL